jgi:hypothetical protein
VDFGFGVAFGVTAGLDSATPASMASEASIFF